MRVPVVTVRAATPDDLTAIMAIERASFPTDAWSERMMADDIASAHTTYLVASVAGETVGYAGLRVVGADGDVQTIAIAEAHRGSGHGRQLVREMLRIADERGVREVFLDVRSDNDAARALYSSEGFAEIGLRRGYYQPDGVDAVVMRVDLPTWRHGPGAR